MQRDRPEFVESSEASNLGKASQVGLTTLIRFLTGSRQGIIDIAASRQSLWLGALFVLSAGFAREYDGEDLLHEPWHVALPLGASLATSFILYQLLHLAARQNSSSPQSLPSYRRFLSLYWMTAPLAWLYAIPVEHFMSAADAVKTNLSLLGVVSLWRVLVISRCAAVLFGSSYIAAFFLVMLFADTLALAILWFTPLPIFNIMGGIRLTESETALRETACLVQFFGGVSWLIWFTGTCIILLAVKRRWVSTEFDDGKGPRVSKPLWAVSIIALAVWSVVLPITQTPQRLRRIAEESLLNGQVAAAIRGMSTHRQTDYPPHWDPPPWPGYGQDTPPLQEVAQVLEDESTAEWVRELYGQKIVDHLQEDSEVDNAKLTATGAQFLTPLAYDAPRTA